jgi:hypothetical protein
MILALKFLKKKVKNGNSGFDPIDLDELHKMQKF